jgi:hypothetical protein
MKPYQIFKKKNTHEREKKRNNRQGPKCRQGNNPKKVGHKR